MAVRKQKRLDKTGKCRNGMREGVKSIPLIDWLKIAQDPHFIPLLRRYKIYLHAFDGDGKRFAHLFIETWKQLPLHARRNLLKLWRGLRETTDNGIKLGEIMFIPFIELVDGKSDFSRGNSGNAVANYSYFLSRFAFHSRYMDALSDKAIKAVISHELAHAILFQNTWCLSPEYRTYDEFGYCQAEDDADDLARWWGFEPELFREEILKLEDNGEWQLENKKD